MVLGVSLIALSVAIPAAFGVDLITNTQDQEQVIEPTPVPEAPSAPPEEVIPSAEPTPEVSSTITPTPEPEPSAKSSDEPEPEPELTPEPEPTPEPVHALANQSIYVIAPKQVSVDPRASTTTLPAITVGSSEVILLCASSDKAIFHVPYMPYIAIPINPKKPELGSRNALQIEGQGSTHLRISGPSYAVMSTFNGGNGMRVTSATRAISGSQIHLRFVNMSEATLDGSFCGQGSVSNNRSISIRPLGLDFHMVKSGVNLKKNK